MMQLNDNTTNYQLHTHCNYRRGGMCCHLANAVKSLQRTHAVDRVREVNSAQIL